jgi:hypothetical protein
MSDQWGIPGQNADPSNGPFDPQQQPAGQYPPQQPAGQYPPQFTGDAGTNPGGPAGNPQYAQPGYGYPMVPPQKQSNGMAVAGFVLAFLVWPLGLIFSIIALVRSGKVGGVGRKLAIAGLIISIVVGAGSIALIATQVSNSTAIDPGCTSAESSLSVLDPKLSSVESQISTDADAGDTDAVRTDLTNMVTYLQTAQTDLNHSESVAVHSQVKTQITAVNGDLSSLITAFQAVAGGDDSQADAMTTTAQQLETDGSALDTLCSSY